MKQIGILLFIFSIISMMHAQAQVVIDAKGTKTAIDPSKWSENGSDIYNKNTGGVGVGTAGAVNPNAALEVKSTTKGVLISRVALTGTTAFAPLTAHVAGMMVYNTATAGTAPNNVSPGFYYNDGTKWVRVADATNGDLTKDAWVDDNANTMVKLGTLSDGTTARPVGTEMVVKDNGWVGIGTSTPSWMLDVVGPAAIGQFKRIGPGLTTSQAPGFLFTRAAGSPGAEQNINVGDYLGKLQFRGRVNAKDEDFGTLAYIAEGTTASIADGTIVSPGFASGRFVFSPNAGGTELMNINTRSGNVGIGVTAPRSLLDIKGYAKLGTADATADALTTASDRAGMIRYNSTTKALQYHDDTQWLTAASTATADLTNDAWVNDNANTMLKIGTLSNGTTARPAGTEVVIKDSGKMGIGTAAPQATLHVRNGDFRLENENNWNAYKGITYSDTRYPQLFLFKASGNTKATATYPPANNTLGVFRAANAIDSTGGAGFRVSSTQQQSAAAHGTSMIIFTNPNGQPNNVDQFIVDQNGNTGIGTMTPSSKLTVEESTAATYLNIANFMAPSNTIAGNNTSLKFGVSNTNKNSAEIRFNYTADQSNSNRIDFSFNSIVAPLASITAGGNMGIGIENPTAKLQVAGTVAAPNYTATIQSITGTWNLDLGANANWTLAAGANALTITNPKAGMFGLLKLTNSGTSTITLPAGSKVINGGAGAVSLTQVANAVDILTFYYDGATYWWTYGNNYN
ncbi:hypothetical protein [Pedobacter endophyticus]|uniref:Uncharacterized protein n=1 Tax=Pedobacter endophyticus TaxID=2789740 RepID=A0A7S9L2T8_9SPHI|nr:hypothetical protein [Pedobacter endophyticus]QPH41446.1 hypothetical protein IZT61_09385 [Pedobacter endophyticus]